MGLQTLALQAMIQVVYALWGRPCALNPLLW